MSRRNRPLLVPEARPSIDYYKPIIMGRDGFNVHLGRPEDVKYEVAKDIGIDLEPGYNGDLTSREAGKVGGEIGGRVVKELIKMAENQMSARPPQS